MAIINYRLYTLNTQPHTNKTTQTTIQPSGTITTAIRIEPTCLNLCTCRPLLTINSMANSIANMSLTAQHRSVLGKFDYIGIRVSHSSYTVS